MPSRVLEVGLQSVRRPQTLCKTAINALGWGGTCHPRSGGPCHPAQVVLVILLRWSLSSCSGCPCHPAQVVLVILSEPKRRRRIRNLCATNRTRILRLRSG